MSTDTLVSASTDTNVQSIRSVGILGPSAAVAGTPHVVTWIPLTMWTENPHVWESGVFPRTAERPMDAEPLLSLAVAVAAERSLNGVLQTLVQGLALHPGVALARVWLL